MPSGIYIHEPFSEKHKINIGLGLIGKHPKRIKPNFITYICKNCGVSFKDWRGEERLCCSKECSNQIRTGRKIEKMIGNTNGFKKGIIPQTAIKKGDIGEKSIAWKGGISKNLKHYRQRRLALMKNGGELSIRTIQLIYEDNIKRFGTLTCYLCLKPIEFKNDSLEHKIPLVRGGTNEYNNLAIAHRSCNSKKGKKTVEEFKRLT